MKDTSEIVIGANGTIRVAPVGTVEPADISAAFAPAWVDLGFTSEDGVTIEDTKTLDKVAVWQMLYPARRIITDRDFTVAFAMRQFAAKQIEFAFGGGTITGSGGKYKYVPPDPEDIDERKLAVEWQDGDNTWRLIVPLGIVSDKITTKIERKNPADLPITFSIMGQDGVEPWYFLTDDPTWAEGT